MAAREYSQWNALGRPHTPAQPIRDLVTKLRAAFPQGRYFNWEANEAHYTADPPEDHTPFSYTGWPLPSPHWVVFATDIMTSDVGGAAGGQKLFDYYISQARAGKMPWLKYLIWQAKLYDVRNGWKSQPNSGHFDHIHFSARTDYQNYSLGDWSVVPVAPKPPEDTEMDATEKVNFAALIWRVEAIVNNRATVFDGPTKGEVNQLHVALEALRNVLTQDQLEQVKAAAAAGGSELLNGAVVESIIKKP